MTTKFLTIDQVIEIHDTFLQLYGGLAGIRDHGLLASAVEMPRVTMFGEDVHPTLYDKAAAYLYHIVKNHPFNDGNKRTGAGTALMFLRVNGMDPKYDNDTYVVSGKRTRIDRIKRQLDFSSSPSFAEATHRDDDKGGP